MEWWVSPLIAAVALIVGVLIRGAFDRKLANEQLAQQHQDFIAQLEAQERIAADARADDRVKLLLAERRTLYGEVLEQARSMLTIAGSWTVSMSQLTVSYGEAKKLWYGVNEDGLPPEAWDNDALVYDRMVSASSRIHEVRRALSVALSGLELVAPPEVADPARRLVSRIGDMQTEDAARAELDRLDRVFTDFVRACRKDLGADPDDPTKALRTI